jgi:hypothetical protein
MSILADENPVFQRAMRVISSITNDYPAVVTTTFDHQYLTGLIVRLNIPKGYGMTQANRLYAPIIVTGDTTFTIDIDTRYFDVFAYPGTFPENQQYPLTIPVGESNDTLLNATQNILPFPAE